MMFLDIHHGKKTTSANRKSRPAAAKTSTEMVFRALYHFSQAVLRGDAHEAVPYLVERQKLFGLVKARRKRHS